MSEGALSSLNLGTHRGDRPENVRENYRILGAAVGFSPEETVFTRQEHTDLLLRVGEQDCGTGLEREQTAVCDGILTDEPGVALVCFGADCTTLLLFDPVRQAIAAVHAGWRGTALGHRVQGRFAHADGIWLRAGAHSRGHRPVYRPLLL